MTFQWLTDWWEELFSFFYLLYNVLILLSPSFTIKISLKSRRGVIDFFLNLIIISLLMNVLTNSSTWHLNGFVVINIRSLFMLLISFIKDPNSWYFFLSNLIWRMFMIILLKFNKLLNLCWWLDYWFKSSQSWSFRWLNSLGLINLWFSHKYFRLLC